jgi:protein-S-isoprenylcysteine O-methyltransferase Ste14
MLFLSPSHNNNSWHYFIFQLYLVIMSKDERKRLNDANVFTRSEKIAPHPSPFTVKRLVFGAGHLAGIPVFQWFVSSGASSVLTYFGRPVIPLSPTRIAVLTSLNVLYSTRWAIGGMLMGGSLDIGPAIGMSVVHSVLHQLIPIALAMTTGPTPFTVPYDMSILDKAAVAGLILGAILQHFAEFQRYLFKREPANLGKVHTGGLFAYARFINHVGHWLTDLCQVLLCRSAFYFIIPFAVTVKQLLDVAPYTEDHMAKKYGAQWTNYVKKTPYKFIPGIW